MDYDDETALQAMTTLTDDEEVAWVDSDDERIKVPFSPPIRRKN